MLTIGGESYPARLRNKALMELEALTGMSFISFFAKFASDEMNIKDLLTLIYITLKDGGVELKFDDLTQCDFSDEELDGLMSGMNELLQRTQSVGDGDNKGDKDDKDNTKNPKKK